MTPTMPGFPRDRLVRFVLLNVALGMLVGAMFATMALYFDVARLWSLISRSSSPAPALALLYVSFMVTFGSVVCGTAIMLLPRDDDPPPPKGGKRERVKIGGPAPIRVAAGRPRRPL
jgi:hypothetical protein